MRRREIESLLLTCFAAAPLYLTRAIGILPLLLFHGAMVVIILRVARGESSDLLPPVVMRAIAIAFVPFYVIDAAVISRGAFAASAHLMLFIAVYQASESHRTPNHTQRLLTTAILFIASIATSTHITIFMFVLAFAFFYFRELMHVSHLETTATLGEEYREPPSGRAAAFYVAGTAVIGMLLFPLLPRVRNPWVQGIAGALQSATTGLSDTIDFNQVRQSPDDPTVVARVWMGREAIPFFTPLRLRGNVYDRFRLNTWRSRGEWRDVRPRRGEFQIARPVGFTRTARVQQRMTRTSRLYLPTGTFKVRGLPQVVEGPMRGSYTAFNVGRALANYDVGMALHTQPLRTESPRVTNYPVTPEVAALARQITAGSSKPLAQAARIEAHLARNFRYVRAGQDVGAVMTVDDFLLRVRRGHCEYFAAGMVALMTSLGVPARIVGGFYGGQLNPLTGYFIIRREDAHAWVEVWDGAKWVTFDPTPTSLRPGTAQTGLLTMYASALSDSVNFFWDRYVLTYGLGDQIALAAEAIARFRDAAASGRRAVGGLARLLASVEFVAAFALVAAVVIALAVLARRRRRPFDLLAKHLSALGIEIGPAMTLEEALQKLRRLHPEEAHRLAPLIEMYEEETFSPRHDGMRLRELRRRLAEMR